MNKDQFDQLFDEAIAESASKSTLIPDASSSWKKVERRIRRQQRRKQQMRLLPYIAVSFFLGAFFFGSPIVSATFTPFFQSLQSIQEQMTTIIFGVDRTADTATPKTPPPPDVGAAAIQQNNKSGDQGQLTSTYTTWQEAAPHTLFNDIRIEHQVSGFAPMEVRLFFDATEDYAPHALIAYSDDHGQRYRISMRMLDTKEMINSAVTDVGSQIEQIDIHGSEAILVLMDDGRSSLEYIYMNMFISISGQLTKQQIISVANGIER